jgi:hypothetical protein
MNRTHPYLFQHAFSHPPFHPRSHLCSHLCSHHYPPIGLDTFFKCVIYPEARSVLEVSTSPIPSSTPIHFDYQFIMSAKPQPIPGGGKRDEDRKETPPPTKIPKEGLHKASPSPRCKHCDARVSKSATLCGNCHEPPFGPKTKK